MLCELALRLQLPPVTHQPVGRPVGSSGAAWVGGEEGEEGKEGGINGINGIDGIDEWGCGRQGVAGGGDEEGREGGSGVDDESSPLLVPIAECTAAERRALRDQGTAVGERRAEEWWEEEEPLVSLIAEALTVPPPQHESQQASGGADTTGRSAAAAAVGGVGGNTMFMRGSDYSGRVGRSAAITRAVDSLQRGTAGCRDGLSCALGDGATALFTAQRGLLATHRSLYDRPR
jgi:hypothetical protein